MSAHVEWVSAAGCELEVVRPEEGWTDSYGTGIDDGNVGLAIGGPGNSDFVMVEGTLDELTALARRMLDVLAAARAQHAV